MNKKETARQDAMATLRDLIAKSKPDYDGKPIIYTILRHVSASGMTRFMDLYVMVDNEPRRITWSAAKIMGWTYDTKREALKVGGCGMDLGFHTVYTLSRYLYRDATPDGHKDAGYALRHEWM